MKLIIKHKNFSDYSIVPFEYESKEKFLEFIDSYFKDKQWRYLGHSGFDHWEEIEIFKGIFMDKIDIKVLKNNIYTIEEWFDMNKKKLVIS
jgi:hypothetical protein